MKQPSIDRLLQEKKVLVTCGTGGVGKTTVSAALAARAALLGKKAIVVTIDPAKRLATSLGLDHLGDEAHDLTGVFQEAHLKNQESKPFTGQLFALMPDTRLTFENFVAKLAPDSNIADRVMRNPIFQVFAKEFAGTNEYMALEKLYALETADEYDLIILDTPPSRNTLAFLEAPRRLGQFMDEKVIRWLVLPANKLVSAGMRKALGVLERLTGSGFMTHLFDFAAALFEVRVNFLANLDHITDLLQSEAVGFLLVSTADPEMTEEIHHFVDSVQSHEFHFDGLALNRTLSYLEKSDDSWNLADPSAVQAKELLETLLEREKRALEGLLQFNYPIHAKLPEFARDIHSVEDLYSVALSLDGKPHWIS